MASTAFDSATTAACACSMRRAPPAALERAAHASHQLRTVEGLEDDVVGTGVERLDAVVQRRALGEREDGQ